MTKEDIVRKHYENKFAAPPYDKSVNRGMIFDYVAPAMDEYAQQQAAQFAIWVDNDTYRDGPDEWRHRFDNFTKHMTTNELYQLFLQQNKD